MYHVIDVMQCIERPAIERKQIAQRQKAQYEIMEFDERPEDIPEAAVCASFPNPARASAYAKELNGDYYTLAEAAKAALQVQDACNIGGVSIAFRHAVQAVLNEAQRTGKGTDWVNAHPILILFYDKMMDMGKRLDAMRYSWAADICEKIAAGQEVEV